ncbi:hypothetical protein CHS0354_031173 [Potamilus streckersoni]|uniref:Ig-like domain-containing protein n=1 Tax=Potamilus streckersoni TaxID=2493646 RepID=A0AAE0WFM6_9BIVA|nr:hypothetical protein CHS0354_031173 [Potamilus streckersoni]
MGSPITHVSWSFNGNTLTNNKLKHYWPTSTTPNLDIENLAITDAGIYKCSASNDVGTRYASINLIVIGKQKLIFPLEAHHFDEKLGECPQSSLTLFEAKIT